MKKSSTSFRCSSLLFFFFIVAAFIVVDSQDGDCSYRLIVQTGTVAEAGTDSIISVTLGNSAGKRLDIENLMEHGTMEPGDEYFEKGNVDDFFLTSQYCFDTPVCNITVTSDGSGEKPGWFLENVQVSISTGSTVSPVITFVFRQWLANDEPPNKLTASVNGC